MRQKINLEDLLAKYKSGTCSEEELALLENWYLQWKAEAEPLSSKTLEDLKAESWANQPIHQEKIILVSIWPRVAAAALIVFCLSAALYFYLNNNSPRNPIVTTNNTDIAPGKNQATLTLADGRKVILSESAKGKLAEQTGVNISITDDGQIIYTLKDSGVSGKLEYNTLSTSRGEQYQVILPDGTKVWLNAATSLKYPVSFAGSKLRKIELEGEAYFEVAKDKARPFIVKTLKQEVEVLGTHFNINSYSDEKSINTTLLEGSVKVSSEKNESVVVFLKPGEQSQLIGNEFRKVTDIDLEEIVAWKKGVFQFNGTNLHSIMRQLGRWYNVDADISNMPQKEFYGVISRDVKLSKVLKMLELTSRLNFKIKQLPNSERRIILIE